jgi:hypothetical protein
LTLTRSGPEGYLDGEKIRSQEVSSEQVRGPEPSSRTRLGKLTRGEWMLLVVAALAFAHHMDHVLRADNSGWPFTPDVTPFTISLLVYPILLRSRPWVRVALVAGLFAALQVAHAVYEPPADQYGTWANGVSSVRQTMAIIVRPS